MSTALWMIGWVLFIGSLVTCALLGAINIGEVRAYGSDRARERMRDRLTAKIGRRGIIALNLACHAGAIAIVTSILLEVLP